MKMMLKLVFGKQTPCRLRFLALLNITGCLYFLLISLVAGFLVCFQILPHFYTENKLGMKLHRLLVFYVSVNGMGNFILCVCTDTSVNRRLNKNGVGERTRNQVTRTLCEDCRIVKPERSHHCHLCRSCILKRDHHCFFTAACIGYHNQKHFIMYCLFMFIGTFYTLVMVVKYMNSVYGVQFFGPQTFVTLLVDLLMNSASGKPPSLYYLLLVVVLYSSLVMGLVAIGFLYWQITIATAGQTTYEAWRGMETYAQRHITDNLKDVFGQFWPLLILAPLPLPQYGDGTYRSTRLPKRKND